MLERAAELNTLHSLLAKTRAGEGQVVLVSGEMGIGKTTLVETFLHELPAGVSAATLLFDSLSFPSPLGPMLDLVQTLTRGGTERPADLAAGLQVWRAIEEAIRGSTGATVIVAEDAHWADQASLETLRFLGRRMASLPAMLVVTYRDDGLSSHHPLRQMVGDLATNRSAHHLPLGPLSIDAVRALAAGTSVSPESLHAYTGGNAFFVTEVLATGNTTPISIKDAVLGRASSLTFDARETLDAIAAFGAPVVPLHLANVVGRPIEDDVAAAFDAGLLRTEGNRITLRHAAIQAVIEAETSPARAIRLHQRILTHLEQRPDGQSFTARLAFHAEAAHNFPAAYRYAIAAAEEASRLQSHRETADQYARALRCAGIIAPITRANMLEAHAFACFLTSQLSDATTSQQMAADLWLEANDLLRYGLNLRRLSRYWLYDGRYRLGAELAEESVRVLQAFPDSAALALSLGYLAEWRIRAFRLDDALDLAKQSIAIANRLDDPAARAHALITLGMVELLTSQEQGQSTLEAGLALARQIGHLEYELRAIIVLGEANFSFFHRTTAQPYLNVGLALAQERDLSTMAALYGSARLISSLNAGDWETTIGEAEAAIVSGGGAGRTLLTAHIVAARARLRSGKEPTLPNLEAARNLATNFDDPVAIAMVQSTLLEQAWLADGEPAIITDPEHLLHDAYLAGDLWTASELALWQHRLGLLDAAPVWLGAPWSEEILGDITNAAPRWDEMGMPLESLRAQSVAISETSLRSVHTRLLALGAVADAARVARTLQRLGYRGIPRGPRPSTRANANLLSRRELEVLTLLADGVSDRDIAQHLSVSPKTAGHHVSAILRKLGVPNRRLAVAKARERGILPK